MILISSCLFGIPCRYDGTCSNIAEVKGLARREMVPVCPEVLGGLPVPRPPAEIQGGTGLDVLSGSARIVNVTGADVTEAYVKGAFLALSVGLLSGCRKAILKARSPACGLGWIYDGTFSRTLRRGDGVLASLLRAYGFSIFTETDARKALLP